jgi:hypothetical protein
MKWLVHHLPPFGSKEWQTDLAHSVAVGIEESERVVGTRVHGKSDFGDVIISVWRGLGASKRTFVVRATNIELVVVCGVWFHVLGFDLGHISEVSIMCS